MKAALRLGAFSVLLAAGACSTTLSPRGAIDPKAAASYNLQLGIDYLRQGNLSQAKEKIERSLEQNPRDPQAHVAAGMLYDRIGQNNEADEQYSRAIDLDPKNAELLNSYAVFLCRKGDRKKGEQMALKAAVDPLYKTPEAAYLNAGLCALGAKQNDRAEKYFRSSLAVKPDFTEALFQMADLELNAGNYLPARAFLQRYMSGRPVNPSALWLGVRIEKGLGNVAAAADYARRLKTDFPTANETKELLESERSSG